MSRLRIVSSAREELDRVPVFYRRALEEAIEKYLRHEPEKGAVNRKRLQPLAAGFEHEEPLWELRIGEGRVFYDVDAEARAVVIRAIRKKLKHQRTEKII
ncbi:MAG: type II toxin-antitoxin system RelE/ParE family toxin [Deltaproteobacteria bacterium]|nr:type II toxin-antitoxin system RelE/ParE family toxin [Deltaproteobacteria bacterium]